MALANVCEARLTVCHVLDPRAYEMEEARRKAEEGLARLVAEYIPPWIAENLVWEGLVIEGDPTVNIVQEAAERGCDLMVIESRRRPHAAAIFGSTAEAICRETPCPVLVIHANEHDWEGVAAGEIGLKRILAAQDFSPAGDAASAYAAALAQEYQTEFHLLHVAPESYPETPGDRQFVEEQLERTVSAETRLWCTIKPAIRTGKPADQILAYAKEQESDLICVGKHSAGGGLSELFGANTDRILRQAECPVLVAPAAMSAGRG